MGIVPRKITDVREGDPGNGCFVEDEQGECHCFHPHISATLRARGVIFQQGGKWRIKRADVDIVQEQLPHIAVCDFCSDTPVTYDVDAETFEDSIGNVSVGGWAACEACGQAIIAGNRALLLQRAIRQYELRKNLLGAPSGFVRQTLRENQALFWKHYRGIKRYYCEPPPTP